MSDNTYMARYMSDRYLLLKIQCIQYKGGKCQNCGYDRCYAALEFHHRDPKQKDLDWRRLRRRRFEVIRAELDKCDLLCANCHREEHTDRRLLIEVQQRQATRVANKKPPKLPRACKICAKQCGKKYCSQQCAHKAQEAIVWPDDLPELVAASSMRAVGLRLGVSDKAIKKRLLNHYGSLA